MCPCALLRKTRLPCAVPALRGCVCVALGFAAGGVAASSAAPDAPCSGAAGASVRSCSARSVKFESLDPIEPSADFVRPPSDADRVEGRSYRCTAVTPPYTNTNAATTNPMPPFKPNRRMAGGTDGTGGTARLTNAIAFRRCGRRGRSRDCAVGPRCIEIALEIRRRKRTYRWLKVRCRGRVAAHRVRGVRSACSRREPRARAAMRAKGHGLRNPAAALSTRGREFHVDDSLLAHARAPNAWWKRTLQLASMGQSWQSWLARLTARFDKRTRSSHQRMASNSSPLWWCAPWASRV